MSSTQIRSAPSHTPQLASQPTHLPVHITFKNVPQSLTNALTVPCRPKVAMLSSVNCYWVKLKKRKGHQQTFEKIRLLTFYPETLEISEHALVSSLKCCFPNWTHSTLKMLGIETVHDCVRSWHFMVEASCALLHRPPSSLPVTTQTSFVMSSNCLMSSLTP